MKRMLRTYYLALIASTGIRPGLEAKRIRIGNVRFRVQEGRQVIIIRVSQDTRASIPRRAASSSMKATCSIFGRCSPITSRGGGQQGAKDTDDPVRVAGWQLSRTSVTSCATVLTEAQCSDRPDDRRGADRVFIQTLLRHQARRTRAVGGADRRMARYSSRMIEAHYNRF